MAIGEPSCPYRSLCGSGSCAMVRPSASPTMVEDVKEADHVHARHRRILDDFSLDRRAVACTGHLRGIVRQGLKKYRTKGSRPSESTDRSIDRQGHEQNA